MRRIALSFGAALCIALIAITSLLYLSPRVRASDHQDSPLTVSRPGADITDVFVFPANDPSKVVLAMDVWPLIPPKLGTSTFFDPGVLYQFKIGLRSDATEDLVLQFKPDGTGANQSIAMYGPSRPNQTGTRTTILSHAAGTIPYNKVTDLGNGVMAFAGPREDPFYFDLAQFFKLQPDRNFANQPNPPPNSATCFRNPGVDFLANYNVLSLVVELPRTMLADGGGLGRINVWATTSIADANANSAWTQVERLGRPAIKEAFEAFRNHDATNRSALTDDATLAKSIHDYMIHVAGRSNAVADAAVKVLMPDFIEADLSQSGPARYLAVETNGKSGFPVGVVRAVPPDGIEGIKKALGDPYRQFGGRDPKSPVIDLSLGAIYGSLIPKLGFAPDDRRETDCLTSDHTTPAAKHPLRGFPYIGDPR